MAIVQYTAIVNQIRGKLNGTVFNKARTVNTMQRKQQQPQGSRGYQSEIRNIFSTVQRRWKSLSALVQTNWGVAAQNNPARDRFGNQVVLSGYNQFIKAGILRDYADRPNYSVLDINPAPVNTITAFSVSALSFSKNPDGSLQVQSTISVSQSTYGNAWGIIIDVSLPMSGGQTSYHGRYNQLYGTVLTLSAVFVANVDWGTKYPMPQAGQSLLFRARLVYLSNGAIVATNYFTYQY